jgi:F-type H+-transporting ATPase subunit gamma
MALQTKVIKQKIRSVGNVKKVTKTMELISISKMRKAVAKRLAGIHYGHYIMELLVRLSAQQHLIHPLFEERNSGKIILIIFTSDRGLCGQFHSKIDRRVRQFLSNHEGQNIECVAIGKYALQIAKRYKLPIVYRVDTTVENMKISDLREVGKWVTDSFSKNKDYKSVSCVFNQFESSMAFNTVRVKLLPIKEELMAEIYGTDFIASHDRGKKFSYTVEPNEEEVLDEVLPELFALTLNHFLLESNASEHSARMVAMRRASDNAGRMQDKLVRDYNRARQEAVTKEIIEIVSAAEAMK